MTYRAVSEKTIYIDLPKTNGLKIKGILRGDFTVPLVVMMHGRPGSGNELLQFLGARYLHEKGFSTLRLFMYDFEKTTRNLLDCTLQTHTEDFEAVVNYLKRQNVPKIFAVGHSYGGLTILKSQAKLDGAVLWDPTHGLIWHDEPDLGTDFPKKTYDNVVVGLAGPGYITPKPMEDDDLAMGDTTNLAAHKGYPLKLIAAGKGKMSHLGKRYIKAADEPKKFLEIADAHHQLEDSDEVMQKLFKETVQWFERILNDKTK